MKKIRLCALCIIGAIGLALLAGCDGNSDERPVPTAPVQIMLVDAPASNIAEMHLRFDGVHLARRASAVQRVLKREDLPEDIDVIAAGETPVILGTVDLPVGTYTWANLSIDPASPVNRIVTEDGAEHPLQYTRPRAETANLGRSFKVVAGEEMTLLFDFSAAASVCETSSGWVLNPRIFTSYVGRDVQFGSLSGVVSVASSGPLVVPDGLALGVVARKEDGLFNSLAEVTPETGEYRIPKVLPGRIQVAVALVDAEGNVVGEPLFEDLSVRVTAGQEREFNIDISL